MTGKDKCKILKDIRKQIAEANDIEWVVSECKHKGNCRGTCPKCEAEVRQLERELESRRNIGKKVALVGLSVACIAGLAACSSGHEGGGELEGDVPYIESQTNIERLEGEVEYIPESIYELDGDVADINYVEEETAQPMTDGMGLNK